MLRLPMWGLVVRQQWCVTVLFRFGMFCVSPLCYSFPTGGDCSSPPFFAECFGFQCFWFSVCRSWLPTSAMRHVNRGLSVISLSESPSVPDPPLCARLGHQILREGTNDIIRPQFRWTTGPVYKCESQPSSEHILGVRSEWCRKTGHTSRRTAETLKRKLHVVSPDTLLPDPRAVQRSLRVDIPCLFDSDNTCCL